MLLVAGKFLIERCTGRVRQLRGWRLHHRQNRTVPVESRVELNVAFAPVQIGRNQRVDVGIDLEMLGSIEARPDRKAEGNQNSYGGKPGTGLDNRNN